ncbi:MAG: NAD-dependent deacylase [Bacteroidetes bacterium]|nr:NAD-dependent deacylase [Bacteroidota bacterium]
MSSSKPKIVVFSGAGISAESGISTFRDSGGLWEKYDVRDVATPEAWRKNPDLVLEFYNQRRRQVIEAQPNGAHFAIAELGKRYETLVITQNVDDLHERAGTKNILHLHGEIRKVRSTLQPSLVYPLDGWELKKGDSCELGSQLRPHIVWFGESVPEMDNAVQMVQDCDVLLIVGTSLNVYPAAGLVHEVPAFSHKFLIDPQDVSVSGIKNLKIIKTSAVRGVPEAIAEIEKLWT